MNDWEETTDDIELQNLVRNGRVEKLYVPVLVSESGKEYTLPMGEYEPAVKSLAKAERTIRISQLGGRDTRSYRVDVYEKTDTINYRRPER